MDYLNDKVSDFTEQLASSSPVPGGGSASALAGAVGIALGSMVGELTVGKRSGGEETKALMTRAQELREKLLACVEKDAEAFAPLSRAYGIPKDTPGREATMEKCLRDAAAVPLEIFDICCEAIDLQKEFAGTGGRLVVSDAATGVMLCWGALCGAAMNVRVNTKPMKDREYAAKLNARVDEGMAKYRPIAEKTYEDVYRRFL